MSDTERSAEQLETDAAKLRANADAVADQQPGSADRMRTAAQALEQRAQSLRLAGAEEINYADAHAEQAGE